MKYAARALALGAALSLLATNSVDAATKAQSAKPVAEVNVRAVSPIALGTLTGAPGDQVSSIALTATSALLVGTVEGATGKWVTSAPLGGSDGFVSAIDFSGDHLWDLRLGSSNDDQASAITKDGSGYFWIVGSSLPAATASPSPTPSDTTSASPSPTATPPLNPNGIAVTPFPSLGSGMSQLDLWKISKKGLLLGHYFATFQGVIDPLAIQSNPSGLTISGQFVVRGAVRNFTLAVTTDGSFAPITILPLSAPAIASNPDGLSLKYGQTSWRTLLSKGPTKGISNWWPAKPTYLMIATNQSGRILDARAFLGSPIAWAWQRSPGVVLVTERSDGFGLTIVSPLAG